MAHNQTKIINIAQAALMAGLCYIGFLIRFDIPVGDSKTAIHLGNTFCVLGALLLGGPYGGMAGAVGMTIADLTSGYAQSAPKTFLLKLCIGLIVGLVAHKIGKLNQKSERKQIILWSLLGAVSGMVFNVIFDPIAGYIYKRYLLGVPQQLADIFYKWSAIATLVNAVTAVVIATSLYCILRPALQKQGLLKVKAMK
jgi:uncharacterized membrane protein